MVLRVLPLLLVVVLASCADDEPRPVASDATMPAATATPADQATPAPTTKPEREPERERERKPDRKPAPKPTAATEEEQPVAEDCPPGVTREVCRTLPDLVKRGEKADGKCPSILSRRQCRALGREILQGGEPTPHRCPEPLTRRECRKLAEMLR